MASVHGCAASQTAMLREELTDTSARLAETDSKRSAGEQHETASPRVQVEEPCVCASSVDNARAKVTAEALACAWCTALVASDKSSFLAANSADEVLRCRCCCAATFLHRRIAAASPDGAQLGGAICQ